MADYIYPEDNGQNDINVLNAIQYTNKNTDDAGMNNLKKFVGFYDNRYVDPFISGYAFVFMTKPQLFIDPYSDLDPIKLLAYQNMLQDPFFTQFTAAESMNENDLYIAKMLLYNEKYRITNFLPIITNNAKGFSNLGVDLETLEMYNTKKGYRMPLPSLTALLNAANTFQITIPETQNLDVTKMIALWVNYMNNSADGIFYANPSLVSNGVLDFMSLLYYFILEPDGKTLKYWVKYTGCFPLQIPLSALSYNRGDQSVIDIDLSFNYTIKEEMNPDILKEFNLVSMNMTGFQDLKNDISLEGYSNIKDSKFLNPNKLKILDATIKEPERDPIILYNAGTGSGLLSDKTKGHLELLFGASTYTSSFQKKVYGDNYYMTAKALSESLLDDTGVISN